MYIDKTDHKITRSQDQINTQEYQNILNTLQHFTLQHLNYLTLLKRYLFTTEYLTIKSLIRSRNHLQTSKKSLLLVSRQTAFINFHLILSIYFQHLRKVNCWSVDKLLLHITFTSFFINIFLPPSKKCLLQKTSWPRPK